MDPDPQQKGGDVADELHPLHEDVRDTLAIMNVVRGAFGEPMLESLPTSIPGNASECLYSRGFGSIARADTSGEGHITFEDNDRGRKAARIIARMTGGRQTSERSVQTPAAFRRVIEAFDRKEFGEFNQH